MGVSRETQVGGSINRHLYCSYRNQFTCNKNNEVLTDNSNKNTLQLVMGKFQKALKILVSKSLANFVYLKCFVVENFGKSVFLSFFVVIKLVYRHYINTPWYIESVYHECKEIWDAAVNRVGLPCKREPGNLRNNFVVAIQKPSLTGNMTVALMLQYVLRYLTWTIYSLHLLIISILGIKCIFIRWLRNTKQSN